MKIRLTWREVALAAQAAVMRRINAEAKNWEHRNTGSREGMAWDHEIIGAIAELAACKAMGVYWSSALDPGAPDTRKCEIRATAYHNGQLILRASDRSDLPYVLAVVSRLPEVILAGWIWPEHGKLPEFWAEKANRPGCWWVPQNALRPMAEIISAGGVCS